MPPAPAVARARFDWTELPPKPELQADAVHLVCVETPADYRAAEEDWALLNPAESARAERFRFDLHRSRWIFGRTRLKRLLGRYLQCAPHSVSLAYGGLGKPSLATPSAGDIRFNYTDSGGHLIYAFAAGAELGIDVEHLPRPTRYQALARRKFSGPEQAALQRLAEGDRELAFLAGWTRKEAWGKALGVGIRYPMQAVTLCPDFAQPSASLSDADRRFRLLQFEPCFDGIACVVVEGARRRFETHFLR